MLKNKQLYRLMNGMDGVPIDREKVTTIAEHNFETATSVVRAWLISSCGDASGAELLFNDLWALLHGMAALYLDRSAPFDLARAQGSLTKLLIGTREHGAQRPQRIKHSTVSCILPSGGNESFLRES